MEEGDNVRFKFSGSEFDCLRLRHLNFLKKYKEETK